MKSLKSRIVTVFVAVAAIGTLGAAATMIAAASAPSTASARVDLNPPSAQPSSPGSSSLCSEVCSGGGYGTSSVPTQTQQSQLRSYQQAIRESFGPTPGGLAGPAIRAHSASAPSVPPTTASSQQGFQWSDAGIGAAGMFLLLTAPAATAVVARRRHHRATTG